MNQNRIDPTTLTVVLELAQGNPGTMTLALTLVGEYDFRKGSVILQKLLTELPTLRGDNLYVLWSDLCGRDMEKVYTLVTKCPPAILEDACSRQDYSGRSLVAPYYVE